MKKCPECGSGEIAPILYGKPLMNDEMQRKIDGKKVFLGGCAVSENAPRFHCFGCGKNFGAAPDFADADFTVYRDEHYALGRRDGLPFVIANGKRFSLSCHPFDPCLYIEDESGLKASVRSAFDPSDALKLFANGKTVTSITGFRYDARDFCRMIEYAAQNGCVDIDGAERVFGDRKEKKTPPSENGKNESGEYGPAEFLPDAGEVISGDPFFEVIEDYPDAAVEYRLVKTARASEGIEAHRGALAIACRDLFYNGEGEVRRCDCRAAKGTLIGSDALFAVPGDNRCVNYRGAFKYPPHGIALCDEDFDRVNAALFPNGTDGLEVCEWTTDWSDYFDDGREWWGALCLTVYDRSLDRFAVIAASATD